MQKLPAMLSALLLVPALTACSAGQSSATTASSSPDSLIGNTVDHALDEAGTRLKSENITISNDRPGLPRAEITPQGDLLIGGKAVPVTPAQRAMLLDYHAQIMAIAAQGMEIGRQGASLGMKAAGEALTAVFSGQSDKDIERRVEAQAQGIKRSALKICDRLPELMASQQKLAATLPAFKPYATMTRKDIDDCRTDALHDDDNN